MHSPISPAKPNVATEERKRFNLTTFSSLQYRDFRFLWGSTFFTAAGNWIQQITLGWLVYHLTSSAFLTGAISGVRALPFLFVGPIAGVIADRVDRKLLLIVNHALLGLLGLIFALLIAFDLIQVWHIFVFGFLSGVLWSMNNPVRQTLVPALVPRQALMNAIALNSAAFNLTRMLGPALGGLLIVAFGPATNFFIQCVAYMAVTLMVLPMRIPAKARSEAPSKSVVADLKDGLRYVAKEPTTLALVLVGLIPSIFMMPFTQGLMPVFAKEALHVDADGLGIIYAAAGVGAFVGTMTLASLSSISRKGILMIAAASIAGLSLMAFSEIAWLPLAIVVIAIQGGFQMVYNSTNNTVLQIITPDEYRGRVMSIYMLDHGLAPLGSFFAGAVAEFAGVRLAMLAGGGITLLLVLLLATRSKELVRFKE
ncbi:MAG: MFS transporter [Chloroflexi bacterium]|nr:MFS transporter [Chloroflexota bacterium]